MTFPFRLLFHPARLALLGVVLAAFSLQPAWNQLLPDWSGDPAFQISVDDISLSPAPRHVPKDLLAGVMKSEDGAPPLSLLDQSLLPRLAERLESNPWIRRVVRMEKRGAPAGVIAEVEYQQPVAVVQLADGTIPVSEDQTVLPPRDFTDAELAEFPKITGVVGIPPSEGMRWEDARIVGAVQICEELSPYWRTLHAVSIHAGASRDPEMGLAFELELQNGSRVVWGAPPGMETVEPTSQEKIRRLRRWLADEPELASPLEIDLRPWQNPITRPLDGKRVVTQRSSGHSI